MNFSRQQKRGRIKEANKRFKLPTGEFKPIDLSVNPHPYWMTRAFMNNRYVVMIDDNAKTSKGNAIKAMIQRHDDSPIPNHWSELQKIKNEIFGSETIGIEFYPKESHLINDHNIYWLWIFNEEVIPVPMINTGKNIIAKQPNKPNGVCPLCQDTGIYTYGGSFGGSVIEQRCPCGRNI